MKKRSIRLNPLIKIAEAQEKQKLQVLLAARHELAQQMQRLAELKQYLIDYKAELQSLAARGMVSTVWRQRQAFFHAVLAAITQQDAIREQAELQLAQAQAQWLAVKQRFDAISKAQTKMQSQEQQQANLREQKRLDDWATTRHPPQDK